MYSFVSGIMFVSLLGYSCSHSFHFHCSKFPLCEMLNMVSFYLSTVDGHLGYFHFI